MPIKKGECFLEFPFGQRHEGSGEEAHHSQITGHGCQFSRFGEKVIPCHDGGVITECAVQSRHTAAQRGFIDGIIMNKAGRVQQFHRRGHGNQVFQGKVIEFAGKQSESRAHPFPSTADRLLYHLSKLG